VACFVRSARVEREGESKNMIAKLNDLYIKDADGRNPKSNLPTCRFGANFVLADQLELGSSVTSLHTSAQGPG